MPIDGVKLNFDGASKGNPSLTGAIFVLSDSNGDFVLGGLKHLGIESNNEAEWEVLLASVQSVYTAGYRNLVIEGDSQIVVNIVNKTFCPN